MRPGRGCRTLLLALCALGTGCSSNELPTGRSTGNRERPSLPQTYRPTGRAAAGDVAVHLFDWRWDDIATECETVLGPAGFDAVQVSPPQEHSITPTFDWSERYQPVSYSVERSRSGTGDEFRSMIERCGVQGVGIIVDAVINHMTNFPSPGTGSNGTAYTKYAYPGLYAPGDFHAPCALVDYSSAANVQDCELFSLPDLDTGSPTVRRRIADYLLSLARMGVAGFRIDAAKHIQQTELDSIVGLVERTLAAESRPLPYWYLEISSGGGEALSERDFFGVGYRSGGASDITEFTFTGVGDKFRGIGGQRIGELNPNGPPGAQFSASAWGLIPDDKAVVFLANHDTQHSCGLGYRDGQVYRLAHVWMLAQPYGYPLVLSSFAFDCPAGNSMGPPSDAGGWTLPVRCAASMETAAIGEWVCEHRDPYILPMAEFRSVVAGSTIGMWWNSSSGNVVFFSRGEKGFVMINREASAVTPPATTLMPSGDYCDILTGGRTGDTCAGRVVEVRGGAIDETLEPNTAIAIHAASRLQSAPNLQPGIQ